MCLVNTIGRQKKSMLNKLKSYHYWLLWTCGTGSILFMLFDLNNMTFVYFITGIIIAIASFVKTEGQRSK